jgi:hypothetical protein
MTSAAFYVWQRMFDGRDDIAFPLAADRVIRRVCLAIAVDQRTLAERADDDGRCRSVRPMVLELGFLPVTFSMSAARSAAAICATLKSSVETSIVAACCF